MEQPPGPGSSTAHGYTYPLLTTASYPHAGAAGQPWVVAPGPNAGPIAPGDEILAYEHGSLR